MSHATRIPSIEGSSATQPSVSLATPDARFETERLAMRPFDAADAVRIADLAGDFEVARMCGRVPHPYPVLIAEGWITIQAASRARGDEFPFAITCGSDGLIGSCGLTRLKDHPDTWELGYWLGRPYWGAGYATEAALGLMEWGQRALGARVFTAGHFLDNPSSGNVLRKAGFTPTVEAPCFSVARGQSAASLRHVWPPSAAGSMERGS